MSLDREYFTSENPNYGYRYEGYRDFAVHFVTVDAIMKMCPESVLDIGGARGYVAKKLIAAGVPTKVMERSEHCFHTRVVEDFLRWDIEHVPYPLGDKSVDLVFSDSVFEHIHYEKLDAVIREIVRVGKRAFIGIALNDGKLSREMWAEDATHVIFETKEWWEQKFHDIAPDFEVVISGNIAEGVEAIPVPLGAVREGGATREVKLNFGCFIDCFYFSWINLDVLDLHAFTKQNAYLFQWCDARQPLKFPDNSVDVIFSSHFLEHLTKAECDRFLKECYRIMRPGAYIRIVVPDAEKLCWYYQTKKADYFAPVSPGVENSKYEADKLWEILLAGHKRIFDRFNLVGVLQDAGFNEVTVATPFKSACRTIEDETITSYPELSLVVDGRKTL